MATELDKAHCTLRRCVELGGLYNSRLQKMGCEEGRCAYTFVTARAAAEVYGDLSFVTIRSKFWIHHLEHPAAFMESMMQESRKELDVLTHILDAVQEELKDDSHWVSEGVRINSDLQRELKDTEGGLWAHLHVMQEDDSRKRVNVPNGASLARMSPQVVAALQTLVRHGLLASREARAEPVRHVQYPAAMRENVITMPVEKKAHGVGFAGCKLKQMVK